MDAPDITSVEYAQGFVSAIFIIVPVIWGALHFAVIKPLRADRDTSRAERDAAIVAKTVALAERDAAVEAKNEFMMRLLRKVGVIGD